MWTACVAGGVARTSCVCPWVRFQLLPVFFKVFSSSLPSRHHVAPCWSFQPPPHGRMFFLMYVGCVCRRGGGDSSWWSAWPCRFLLMVNHLVSTWVGNNCPVLTSNATVMSLVARRELGTPSHGDSSICEDTHTFDASTCFQFLGCYCGGMARF